MFQHHFQFISSILIAQPHCIQEDPCSEFCTLKLLPLTLNWKLTNIHCVQYLADTLPFGGVGECGFGRYHGKFSFDAFSHEKAIARRSFFTDFWFRFPPWTLAKFQLLEAAYDIDYLGLLLIILGLKRSPKRSAIWANAGS